MNTEELNQAFKTFRRPGAPWYKQRAAIAIDNDNYLAIPTRNGGDIYMVRFWLGTANRDRVNGGIPVLDSDRSVLLHWFLQRDDDGALHDHPWDFTTTILEGGYVENSPARKPGRLGPTVTRSRTLTAGQTIRHEAEDLHAVAALIGDTWTLVTTGPRVRDWGFHPPGKPWVSEESFLRQVVKTTDQTVIPGFEAAAS